MQLRKFSFFAPHRLLVQKVETTSIMQNSGQVSPPPATRITTPYMFAASQQADKQITVQWICPSTSQSANFRFLLPTAS